MYSETWQQLLALETRDTVFNWHKSICERDLNAQRIHEITSAAKQAREFFRSASGAHNSVRPLLSFYGVSSLSKALLLLLKPGTGEAALVPAHGLMTLEWRDALSKEGPYGLNSLASLKVKTSAGLFSDFVRETNNKICIHVTSSAVDWRINHDKPAMGDTVTFGEILSRTPDLLEYLPASVPSLCVSVNEMTYSDSNGFFARLNSSQFSKLSSSYSNSGYSVTTSDKSAEIRATKETFGCHKPQFMHSYVHKTRGTIPRLYITTPFECRSRYSQLAVSFMLAYFLGMLARYFPTQWIALSSGTKGDELWPAINSAQKYIDHCFPELVLEFIKDEREKRSSVA